MRVRRTSAGRPQQPGASPHGPGVRVCIVALLTIALVGTPAATTWAATPTSASPTPTAALPATAAPTVAATATAPATPSATPSPTAAPSAPLPELPPIYYQAGNLLYAVSTGGGMPSLLSTLPMSETFQPCLLPDGRLLYPTATGFAAIDRYGQASPIRAPDLNAGESVWSVQPSPDGRQLAWQLFTPAQLGGYTINTGSSRIVLTGRFGGAGSTIWQGQATGADDAVPVLLGWRPASPYSLSGGATLLLQYLYDRNDIQAGVLFNAARGLLEVDPATGDVVNDYLPPMDTDIPSQRALGVSPDGLWSVYGDANTFTPSGEGPLAQSIVALNLNTNAVIPLDSARNHPSSAPYKIVQVRRKGKKKVKHTTTVTLRLYQYFSHHAYVAPGDGRVLYTLVTVSYPPGALAPHVRYSVLVARTEGGTPVTLTSDATGVGWIDGHHAVISRGDGLYSVDVVFGGVTKLAAGAGLRFIGYR